MFELHHLTATEQLEWLRRGDVTPLELTTHYLERIARLDPGIGAFARVDPDRARDRAAAVERLSRALPIWGLPLADKALVQRAGLTTDFGSRARVGFVPDADDDLARAVDAAGAVSLGATASPEFGLASTTEPVAGPVTRNPWDPTLGAGGSSGGAAAAVAAGLLPFAPGSDGGGSVRIPAAATGLVGLKPSRGRIPAMSGFGSLAGLVVAGPLARTVADAGLLLDALVGPGGPAPWATQPPPGDGGPFLGAAVRGEGRVSVGVSRDSPWSASHDIRLHPDAEAALQVAITELDRIGHGLEEVRLPVEEGYAPAFRAVWQAGAAAIPLDDDDLERVEPLTRWLVAAGRRMSARQLAEALAWLAGFERRVIAAVARVDVVLTPALALPPRPLGWFDADDPERNFAQQVEFTPYTSFVNVSGLPAITLPVGQSPAGLPMGVQLIAGPGREDLLLAVGAQLERRLGWARRHPPAWTA